MPLSPAKAYSPELQTNLRIILDTTISRTHPRFLDTKKGSQRILIKYHSSFLSLCCAFSFQIIQENIITVLESIFSYFSDAGGNRNIQKIRIIGKSHISYMDATIRNNNSLNC